MCRNLLTAALVTLPLAAHAAEEQEMTPQQAKMAPCNRDAAAKNLTGGERQKFMSECLSAKAATAANQQDRTTACNKDASVGKLAGDERKRFMSECLKG